MKAQTNQPHIGACSRLTPGVTLCLAVTAVAFLLQQGDEMLLGRSWFEALALAIVLGVMVVLCAISIRLIRVPHIA